MGAIVVISALVAAAIGAAAIFFVAAALFAAVFGAVAIFFVAAALVAAAIGVAAIGIHAVDVVMHWSLAVFLGETLRDLRCLRRVYNRPSLFFCDNWCETLL